MTPDPSLFRPGGQSFGTLIGVVGIAILTGFTSFFVFGGDQGVEAPVPIAVASSTPALPSASHAAEPGHAIVLPPLDESDALVRDLVTTMTSHPALAAWLIPDDLVRSFVVVVDNVAHGDNPAEHLTPLRPTRRFSATGEAPQLGIDPVSHARYNTHAEILAAIDPVEAAELYRTFYPLIAEAYVELGYPDDAFDETMLRALGNIVETPVLEQDPILVPRAAFFEFADDRLEALLPVQKQFLGMGSRNVRAVQASLLDIAREIGLDTSSLAVPVVIR